MKTILSLLLPLCLFCGCSNTENAKPQTKQQKPEPQKVLVAFFSRAGDNYGVGNIKVGNTYKVAQEIARQTNGTLFEIKPAKPYPETYKACTEIAQEEFKNNARPKIKGYVEDMEEYDTIYLGFPIWWGDAPMPVYTFLETYNFNGKQIYPFATHEGSVMGHSESALKKALRKSTVHKGLAIYGHIAQKDAQFVETAVKNWLNNKNYESFM